MVLAKYLFKRFFAHLFLINISLTLLFNLVEFFEKMVRVKHTTTETILVFIALNIIPSFFENLPVASWLVSCMTLKEMHQQNEWETLKLLNVPLKNILFLIVIAGSSLMVFNFIGKEFVTHRIAQSAEAFKQKQFKQSRHQKLFNQWFTLATDTPTHTFCHFDYLDVTTNEGTRLSLFELSDRFIIKTITTAKTFTLQPKTHTILLPQSTTLVTQTKKQVTEQNKKLILPSFFTQLHIKGESPPLKKLFHIVMLGKNTLPDYVYHQLLYLFLNRILIHLLLLLYPLLTFLFFFLFPHHRYYKWLLLFVPYPLAVVLFTATDSLMQTVQHGALAVIPYVTLTAISICTYFSIRK